MPQTRKPAGEKLNDSINVPVPRALKRRVMEIARGMVGSPPHTRVARLFIEEGVERRQSTKELAAAGK